MVHPVGVLQEVEAGEPVHERLHPVRLEEELVGGGGGGPGVHQVVVQRRHPLPGADHVGVDVPRAGADQEGVGREELQERAGERLLAVGAPAEVHREDVGLGDLVHGALVQDVEGADRLDLVAPQLDAHRVAGAHAVDVHDAAPHRELPDLLHQRDPLEAPALQRLGELAQVQELPDAHREAEAGQVGGDGDPLLERPGRGDQDVGPTAEEGLHGLDAEAPDLQVGLGLLVGEGFLLRVQAGGVVGVEEGLQVRLGGGRPLGRGGQRHEGPLGDGQVEGRQEGHVGGPVEPAHPEEAPAPGEVLEDPGELRALRQPFEDRVTERHGPRRERLAALGQPSHVDEPADLIVDQHRGVFAEVLPLADLAPEEDVLLAALEGHRAELLAHPPAADHSLDELGRLLEVVLRPGRPLVEDEFLGGAPAAMAPA